VAGIRVSRPTSAAGIAALFGGIAALPYLVVPSGSLGAMILVYLTQLPLFAAGLWLGVEVSVIAGIAGLVILWAGGSLLTAVIFAGLNAFPVVLLVHQALLARTGGSGTIDWYPPGLLSAWLTGLGLAVVAAVVLVPAVWTASGLRCAKRWRRLTAALTEIPPSLTPCSIRWRSFCLA
jgi:hypothetical protein